MAPFFESNTLRKLLTFLRENPPLPTLFSKYFEFFTVVWSILVFYPRGTNKIIVPFTPILQLI